MRRFVIIIVCLLVGLGFMEARKKKSAPAVQTEQGGLSPAERARLEYYFLAAQRHVNEGHYSAAEELFRHCLQIAPDDAASAFNMAHFQQYLGNDSLAHAMYAKAVEKDPGNVWYLEVLASNYLDDRNMEAAIPVLEKMCALQPNRTDVLSQLVYLYANADRLEDAIHAIDKIELLDERTTETTLDKFDMYIQLEREEEAFAELEALLKEYPNDNACRLRVGERYLMHGHPERALELYGEVRQQEPQNEGLMLAMVEYYSATGQDSVALAMRDSLLYGEETPMPVRQTLLMSLFREASDDSVRIQALGQTLDRLLARPQTSSEFLLAQYAYEFSFLNKTDEQLIPVLEAIVQVEPNNEAALRKLIATYGEQGDYEATARYCQQALTYYSSKLVFHYYLGVSYHVMGQSQRSLEALEAGLRQITEDSDAKMVSDMYAVTGDLLHELGRNEECFAAYDSALVYEPENVMCLNNYAYFLSLEQRDLQRAEDMSYRTVRAEPQNKTYLDTYAWILYELGDYASARNYIDRVVEPDADDESLLSDENISNDVLLHAAEIYQACGMADEARRYKSLAKKKKE